MTIQRAGTKPEILREGMMLLHPKHPGAVAVVVDSYWCDLCCDFHADLEVNGKTFPHSPGEDTGATLAEDFDEDAED